MKAKEKTNNSFHLNNVIRLFGAIIQDVGFFGAILEIVKKTSSLFNALSTKWKFVRSQQMKRNLQRGQRSI